MSGLSAVFADRGVETVSYAFLVAHFVNFGSLWCVGGKILSPINVAETPNKEKVARGSLGR